MKTSKTCDEILCFSLNMLLTHEWALNSRLYCVVSAGSTGKLVRSHSNLVPREKERWAWEWGWSHRGLKVPLWSKKSLPFFLEFLKVCLLNTWLAKFWPLIFIQKLFTLRVNFGFHDPPLLAFKPDRLDLRGLDRGKVTSKAHQLKISACERSLLYMQSASLKVWKSKTPVLHINSVAYTRLAFLN